MLTSVFVGEYPKSKSCKISSSRKWEIKHFWNSAMDTIENLRKTKLNNWIFEEVRAERIFLFSLAELHGLLYDSEQSEN